MSRPPAPLPPSLGREFSVAQARAQGVTVKRLRASDLEHPFRGARMHAQRPVAVDDPEESSAARERRELCADILRRCHALMTIARDGWFFSHATAAVIWGLPLPLRMLRALVHGGIDVAVVGARRAPRGRGIRGHQLRTASVSIRIQEGLPVSSPASLWAQLGAQLSIDELIELGDAIVHIPRERGMLRGTPDAAVGTPGQLEAAMIAGRRTGASRLRSAFGQIRVGSASPPETRLRLAIVRAGLPEPDLDVDVLAADGTPIGYTELAFVAHRILIEYEGDHHRTDRAQWNRDIEKHAACLAAGWMPLRVTSAHVYPDPSAAVARVRGALERAGWQG